jgi:hypothetical protein
MSAAYDTRGKKVICNRIDLLSSLMSIYEYMYILAWLYVTRFDFISSLCKSLVSRLGHLHSPTTWVIHVSQ